MNRNGEQLVRIIGNDWTPHQWLRFAAFYATHADELGLSRQTALALSRQCEVRSVVGGGGVVFVSDVSGLRFLGGGS